MEKKSRLAAFTFCARSDDDGGGREWKTVTEGAWFPGIR